MAKVLIIDDHPCVRESLAQILRCLPSLTLSGQAGSLADGLRQAEEFQPDIAVLDIMLPDSDTLDSIETLRQAYPQIRIIVFTGVVERHIVQKALAHHPHGFIHKSGETAEIAKCLAVVAGGGTYLSSIASAALQPTRDILALLSAREREILALIACGRSSKQIAAALGLTTRTVENHRRTLMVKLKAKDSARLMRIAFEAGMHHFLGF